MTETIMLPALLQQAGAVMSARDGRSVVAHYGSAAGELAVCVRGVGLALRSELATVSLSSTPRSLDVLTQRLLGQRLHAGGAVPEGGAWWCRDPSSDQLLMICHHRRAPRLLAEINRFAGGAAVDRSRELSILGIVGARATSVLKSLGVLGAHGNSREVTPFSSTPVHGQCVSWLLQTQTSALAVVGVEHAAAVWQAIDLAGRPDSIACVGVDSVERYVLLERGQRAAASLL
jgi:hypothetical protein